MEIISYEIAGGKSLALFLRMNAYLTNHRDSKIVVVAQQKAYNKEQIHYLENSKMTYLLRQAIEKGDVIFMSWIDFLAKKDFDKLEGAKFFIDDLDKNLKRMLPHNSKIQTVTITKE